MKSRRGVAGPASVTWHLHADPAMWVAGISSLYLQALHPRAAAGVVQNSTFQADPFGRLARTATFVSVATYATAEEIEHGAARVRRMHRALRGRDRATGETFAVDEPELLLWVHCAATMSYLDVVRRAGLRLDNAQADRYLHEQRQTAALVGLCPDDVPGSRQQMERYLAEVQPHLRAGQDAELVYRFLRRPTVPRRLARLVGAYDGTVGLLAYSLLPEWARRLYGHPAYAPRRATAQLRALRAAAFVIPPRWRWNAPPSAGHVWDAIHEHGRSVRPAPRRIPPG